MVDYRVQSFVALTLLICLGLHSRIASAVTYIVGDANGWSPHVINWTNGKKFKPDDVLVFNYDPAVHNVVEVDQYSYDTCTLGEHATTYNSGHDQITLTQGQHYFISMLNGPNDCNDGMKIELHDYFGPPRA
ncbi:hypothetical protein Tsubulata_028447 [Turnera subulata]|uniref:Basic blue protein n=1 Tax=Turnera subulata TaxID=218843 RepID=A0A9Q0F1D6_9ROSI|nr:hypothetical protein Tsubulata_028447 [Turnera subulata]